ncbi:hypothetical protein C8T65DRAFT_734243 [Cerioporus squamosus]|nr:hypothetical protein C8T65DRAFT_734243 [Cerioporus squamosus]
MMLHTILPSCFNLHQLHLDDSQCTKREIYRVPTEEENHEVLADLYDLVGCLIQLEDLTIPVMYEMGADKGVDVSEGGPEEDVAEDAERGEPECDDADGARDPGEEAMQVKVVSLTNLRALRRLTMGSTHGLFRLPWIFIDLQPLTSFANLTELCIIMGYSPIMPIQPFVHVGKLKMCMPLPPNTAGDYTFAFPNLVHLNLTRPDYTVVRHADVEELRRLNTRRWNTIRGSVEAMGITSECMRKG